MFVSISISYTDLTSSFLHPSSLSRYLIELFRQSLSGVHSDATTAHGKQGKTKKAQRKVTRKKKSFPRRAGEEERKTITETERRKKEDLPNDGTGRETGKENLILGAVFFTEHIPLSFRSKLDNRSRVHFDENQGRGRPLLRCP